MDRKLHEPLTLPKHPDLLKEINEEIIAIKLHHVIRPEDEEEAKRIAEARLRSEKPTWESISELLRRAYNAINEQREDPRRR